MQEHQRLQKIREIGIRLHELGLVSKKAETSYASLAINYLFSLYKMPKPTGVSLQETLQLLAEAVVQEHKLAYRRLSADSVLEFFSHRYQVSAASPLVHPSYRRRNTAAAGLQFA
ncbi:MAG TPA: hypothetical protein DF774_05190 [Rheinheimera sp.]|uniref:hypothetical protein n=1 Tax=Rheinheimera sp. TaxID=1869214 RepID=UPI000EBCAFB3|nr:hypothetical protein [Rheinheimera sp.]HCU65139.1 hypothetical protein [Rheinheimera sp.]